MCLIPVCTKNDFWWMNALLDQYGITNLINVAKIHALTWPTDLHESSTGVQDALVDRQLHPRHVLPGLMQHLLLHRDKQSITTVIKSQIQQSFISSSIVLNFFLFWQMIFIINSVPVTNMGSLSNLPIGKRKL